ncbi:hypothetical protein PAXINDRAFT_8715 [Paxillus involutus ATCC 200175]|nr:hypothetical protein PAXINDRAFT_8715 [Paxillus involutus ATCC 200175]
MSPFLSYNIEVADRRRKCGENMHRRADEHLATPKDSEAEAQARLDSARQKRQERQRSLRRRLRRRLRTVEIEEIRIRAGKLAVGRQIASKLEWARERGAKKRVVRDDDGQEAAGGSRKEHPPAYLKLID